MKFGISAIIVIGWLTVAAAAPATQTMVVGGTSAPTLRTGTEIPVRVRAELSTKNKQLRVGQRFEVETSEPVLLDGRLVIPTGTPGMGEVTSVTNKGMWGKSGHFDVRLLYLRVGDRQIRLSGTLDDKGNAGGLGAAAVSAVVFLPAGFFMTGTSARMPAGTIIKGFLAEDVPILFAEGIPTPALQIPAATAPATFKEATAPSPRVVFTITPPAN